MATKVLIISGGLTHERDVSVRSGRRVANILAQAGYDVVISDVDASLAGAIESVVPGIGGDSLCGVVVGSFDAGVE